MCAVHGGVFMLNRDVDEFVYDDDGRVAGVIANGEVHEHLHLSPPSPRINAKPLFLFILLLFIGCYSKPGHW